MEEAGGADGRLRGSLLHQRQIPQEDQENCDR